MESSQLKFTGFDAALQTLTQAFDAKAASRLFRDPRDDITIPYERIYIISWVDHCKSKVLVMPCQTDGSIDIYFNDSTTLILSADKQ
jgi:cell cycle serine/threonine-protein kinase CDC5/MSD2